MMAYKLKMACFKCDGTGKDTCGRQCTRCLGTGYVNKDGTPNDPSEKKKVD